MHSVSRENKKTFAGATCLVRVDFNIESASDTFRLEAAIPTIRFLRGAGAKVVLLSHRGRPPQKLKNGNLKLKPNLKFTLKIVLPFLKRHLGAITFIPHFEFQKIKEVIAASPKKSIFLLENLRFLPGEEKNDPKLAHSLASLGDCYVNDAFPVCHRKNASVSRLPRLLPAYAGFQLEDEIKNLDSLHSRGKPLVVIIGGAKASDKIPVIQNFLSRADTFLITGVPANTFLKAKGLDIGKSIFEKKMIPTAQRLLKSKKLILPFDFIVHNNKILDIGLMSIKLFEGYIKRAKTIIWNGPPGIFEDRRFALGSEEIARAIARSHAFSVVGGGATTALVHKLGLKRRFGFLSTGGDAMLDYLAGKPMPGIDVLE